MPKFLVNDDGSLGDRNTLSCGSIEHKMGIHANSTCVMNYDGAKGWMVGEENKGLAAMFVMMNAARLGVGIQEHGQADVAYQNAVQYAQDRRQGRALTGPKDPQEKADPLFVHPDVRRMLMDGKATVEGLRASAPGGAAGRSRAHAAETEEERQRAGRSGQPAHPRHQGLWYGQGLVTSRPTRSRCSAATATSKSRACSQYVRDARITMIYEGANGVQAMDLLGRKLAQNGGRAIQAFFAIVDEDAHAPRASEALADLRHPPEKGEWRA